MRKITVGVVATSSVVPAVELEMGVEKLRGAGFEVVVDSQCLRQHLTYAGTDAERCSAFWEMANRPEVEVVWVVRGGYGATRLLPMLDELTNLRGMPPRKLLVGYSDVTALHHYVRERWGWKALHGVMPGGRQIVEMEAGAWEATVELGRCGRPMLAYSARPLRVIALGESVEGMLVGGNLTVWNALTGTPWMPRGERRVLFLEDVGEAWYRVDRMMTQLRQSGGLEGVGAIVLADFTDCEDVLPKGLLRREGNERGAIRRRMTRDEAVVGIFGGLGIPVLAGIPAGHGRDVWPVPLGCMCRVSAMGVMEWWGWE